jgi:hypothetical protein
MTASITDWLVWSLFFGYFVTAFIYLVVTSEDSSDDKT